MSISIDEVKKLGALSRISLREEEAISLQEEMVSILGYIEQINQVSFDTKKEELPLRRNVWRDDKNANEPGIYTEALLSNAPGREGNYLKVKKIL